MWIQHDPLGILDILGVLKSTAVQPNLLAHFADAVFVEVSE